MLVIKPVQLKKEQEKLCEQCSAEYNIDALAYSAFESETFIGLSQFRILDGYAEIYDIKNKTGINDLEALIIMGRAVINFIDLCGIKKVYLKELSNNLPILLEAVQSKDGYYEINLIGYFESPCKKRNVNI